MTLIGSVRACASALLLIVLCCYSTSLSHALTYSTHNTSIPPPSPHQPSPASPHHISSDHSNALALPSPSQLLASPTITSVSGCTSSANGVTRGCNMSSYLTIAGSDFVFAGSANSYLVIAGRVTCSLFSFNFVSPSLIVASVCLYYYPTTAGTTLSLALQLNGTTTPALPDALTFTNVAPVLTGITGCSVPPYASCNNLQTNRLTIFGRNFVASQQAIPQFAVVINPAQLWPCNPILSTMSFTRYECLLPSFQWAPPAPPASTRFDAVIRVLSPNWLEQMISSNVLERAISFAEPNGSIPLVSSSTGGGGTGGGGVLVWQVSGCVDVELYTVECPTNTAVKLSVYGLAFQKALPNVVISDDSNTIPCPLFEISSDQLLVCTFDTSLLQQPLRGDLMNVTVNSSLGSFTFARSIGVTDLVQPPVITTVTGCGADGDRQTEQCTRQSEVRLAGSHFPRWLTPTLVIASQLELPCRWRGSEVWVYCPLDNSRLDDLPKGQLLPIRLRFGNDRVSDADTAFLSIRTSQPPPPASGSSTGSDSGSDGSMSEDDLRGVKVGLFVLCVLALVAIVIGVSVWLVGLWTAHRRAFVSPNGQAAVDMRQVLLH